MGSVEPRQLLENSDDARTPAMEPRFLRGRRAPAIFKGETSNYYNFFFMMIIIPPGDKMYIKVKLMKRYAPKPDKKQASRGPRSLPTHAHRYLAHWLGGDVVCFVQGNIA